MKIDLKKMMCGVWLFFRILLVAFMKLEKLEVGNCDWLVHCLA